MIFLVISISIIIINVIIICYLLFTYYYPYYYPYYHPYYTFLLGIIMIVNKAVLIFTTCLTQSNLFIYFTVLRFPHLLVSLVIIITLSTTYFTFFPSSLPFPRPLVSLSLPSHSSSLLCFSASLLLCFFAFCFFTSLLIYLVLLRPHSCLFCLPIIHVCLSPFASSPLRRPHCHCSSHCKLQLTRPLGGLPHPRQHPSALPPPSISLGA